MKNQRGEVLLGIFIFLLIGSLIILFFYGLFSLRLDFASGSHRIIPTAVDNDIWGNYKVYFRTTEFTKNSDEDYYYIDKNNKELAEEMKGYVKQGKTVMVYYDRYIGFKGISAPGGSPITKIEVIED